MPVELILHEIALICNDFDIKAVLFGSWAKGIARERSDIDIAVECNDDTFEIVKEKINKIDTLRKIDLVNLRNCSKQNFIKEVETYGKILS